MASSKGAQKFLIRLVKQQDLLLRPKHAQNFEEYQELFIL